MANDQKSSFDKVIDYLKSMGKEQPEPKDKRKDETEEEYRARIGKRPKLDPDKTESFIGGFKSIK